MKVLCILWDIFGIIALFRIIADSRGDGTVIIGALIGFALICAVPTYFCFRKKISKKSDKVDNQSKSQQTTITQHPIPMYVTVIQTQQTQTSYTHNSLHPNLISAEFSNENYKDRLIRLCHPKNFINNDNYDKDKVAYANSIYTELFSTSGVDYYALITKAEAKLDLNLLDESDYNNLKEKLNPQNYMSPYNPDKIALANELYAKILDPSINCTKFFEIRTQAQPLLDYLKSINNPLSTAVWTTDAQIQQPQKKEKIRLWDRTTKIFALIFIGMIIFYTIIYYTDIKDKHQNNGISHQSTTIYDNTYNEYTSDNVIFNNTSSPKLITYRSSQYTISYPEDWICKEHPNDKIDVIFGEEVGMAYSVFHIDIDKSLQKIVEDGNKEMKSLFNATIVSNDKIKLCNVDCYKTVISFSLGNGLTNRQISYALKKGKTYYNIRFNGSVIDIIYKEELIETIINSFELR